VFVIAAATAEELHETLKRLVILCSESSAGMHFFFGRINSLDVLVAQTGVGPKKAGAAANRLLKDHAPRVVLSIGAAGAVDPSLHIGDIVIADTIMHHTGGCFKTSVPQSETIAGQLSNASLPVFRGGCFTVGTFIHTAREKKLIFENTGARMIDMESASLAKRFCAAEVPFIDIRIVSDTARENAFNIEAYYAGKKKAGRMGTGAYFMRQPGELLRALRLKRNVRLVSRRIADILELVVF
jgi:adenosylhomocysteine nucleosidase